MRSAKAQTALRTSIQDLALFEGLQGQSDLKNGTDTRPELYVPSGSITFHTLPDVPMVLMAALHQLPAYGRVIVNMASRSL